MLNVTNVIKKSCLVILIPSVGLFILSKVMETFQKDHETLETLSMYEKSPGEAQRFLARVSKNFRWPTSMPEYIRRGTFIYITDDDDEEFELEVGLNYLFFYNALDNGEFAERKNEWVTVHKQRVVGYGQRYDDDIQRVNNGDDYKVRVRVRRPSDGSIVLLPYDFYDVQYNNKLYSCVVDTGAPQTILPHYIKRTLGGRWGWSTNCEIAEGYGAPALKYSACRMFDVSIGDDNNWSKWVQAKITIWEKKPGNQVEYALVGNDVTDQLAYIHEPRNPLKFLDVRDEARLTVFSNTCI
ncbi:hypothetical protein GLOIN_2v1480732 [Rhizophagus clarus]|uniref:Peptidase A2 domain-containing protein n=1 Tax=Rhizophagus clarus TaxID=94130 RepID=A0A8H3LW31_9GLOM|nr:hypothetical protein GLOIN_2v1480732 [Rhizophagus clarus]